MRAWILQHGRVLERASVGVCCDYFATALKVDRCVLVRRREVVFLAVRRGVLGRHCLAVANFCHVTSNLIKYSWGVRAVQGFRSICPANTVLVGRRLILLNLINPWRWPFTLLPIRQGPIPNTKPILRPYYNPIQYLLKNDLCVSL